jgi:hypothetical protein
MAADELRILRGTPTDEELAAIVGVLLLRPPTPAPVRPVGTTRWAASARPGHSTWRTSARWR